MFRQACTNNREIRKESNDETRRQIEEGLKQSGTVYANHAESKVSELQRAYLKKYHPQQDTHSAEVVPNKRFRGKVSALFRGRREEARPSTEPAISEEGIVGIAHSFHLILLDVTSILVFDYDCRVAVSLLNQYRSKRIEYLRDGYDVSDALCYDID